VQETWRITRREHRLEVDVDRDVTEEATTELAVALASELDDDFLEVELTSSLPNDSPVFYDVVRTVGGITNESGKAFRIRR
jgi:hypothetical protein